jgi:hypothetical protein
MTSRSAAGERRAEKQVGGDFHWRAVYNINVPGEAEFKLRAFCPHYDEPLFKEEQRNGSDWRRNRRGLALTWPVWSAMSR